MWKGIDHLNLRPGSRLRVWLLPNMPVIYLATHLSNTKSEGARAMTSCDRGRRNRLTTRNVGAFELSGEAATMAQLTRDDFSLKEDEKPIVCRKYGNYNGGVDSGGFWR